MDGTWSEVALPSSSKLLRYWQSARVDYITHNDRKDLVVGWSYSQQNFVHVFKGIPQPPYFDFRTPHYSEQLQNPAGDLEVMDVNADGRPDIYVVQSQTGCGKDFNAVPPLNHARDVLLVGGNFIDDEGVGHEPFTKIKLKHKGHGCGGLVRKFGNPQTLLLTEGSALHVGYTYLLEWDAICDITNDFCSSSKPILNIEESGIVSEEGIYTFRLLQITDTHLGFSPEDDEETYNNLDWTFTTRENDPPPDLVILSGDQIHSRFMDENATAYYDRLCNFLDEWGVPWAMVYGNYDEFNYEDEINSITSEYHAPKTSRAMLTEVDSSHRLSLTQAGPAYLHGDSNYWLDVHFNGTVSARLFMFDTGGGYLEAKATADQAAWFQSTNDPNVPVIAFGHHPLQLDYFDYDPEFCLGGDRSWLQALDNDGGLYEALDGAGNVVVLGMGHIHGYSFCCDRPGRMPTCFGRKTGYGSKGNIPRGFRIYNFDFGPNGQFLRWDSYVRRITNRQVEDMFNPDNVPFS